jgi:two-component sensor histidine kinase
MYKKEHFIYYSCGVVIFLSTLIIMGWHLNIELLTSLHPGQIATKYNSAAAFILSSISILLIFKNYHNRLATAIVITLSSLVISFATLSLLKFFFHFPFDIDELLFATREDQSGRMAFLSSINFVLLNTSILLLVNKKFSKTANVLSIIIAFISLFTFIGYIFDEKVILGLSSYVPIAFPSAINFLLLSSSVLFCKPAFEFLKLFQYNTSGAIFLRRVLPLIFIVPVIIGWLRWQGEVLQIIEAELGIALFTFLFIIILLFFLIYSAGRIHLRELEKQKFQAELQELNSKLEHLVKERTKELSVTNQELENAMADQEMLFREVHHRVKNNMQLIVSIINLEKNKIKETGTITVLKDIQNRVRSMSIVHEHLYRTQNITTLDFKTYLTELVSNILSTSTISIPVRAEFNIDDSRINPNEAIYIGLIVNELITNSLKYAFDSQEEGVVSITFRKDTKYSYLTVSDNGIGLPDNLNLQDTNSLGLVLISTLIEQLEGELQMENNNGAFFKIRFDSVIFESF